MLEGLAQAGTAILLVAHKLDEVMGITDRITVLRRGRWIMTEPTTTVTAEGLVAAMIGESDATGDPAAPTSMSHVAGQEAPTRVHRSSGADPSEPVARLDSVSLEDPDIGATLTGVDLAVHRGEIVGIAGVEGNGQRELAAVLAGLVEPTDGEAHLPDVVGMIPQDRSTQGLIGDFSIVENIALAVHAEQRFRRGPFLDWGLIGETAEGIIRDFDVRTPSGQAPVRQLSGGNQQKVLTGREFLRAEALLVAENPTRGLDIRATAAVRQRLLDLAHAEEPPGVVLISTDLDEVLDLSDRVFALVRGRLHAVPEGAGPTEVGELMLGLPATGAGG